MLGYDHQKQHISGQFNSELETLKSDILAMGGLVEAQLTLAMAALLEKNSAKALEVIANDKLVNELERQIDQECARILARRQPAASDLRLVLAVLKINLDLERVGDEAAKIARQAKVIVESSDSGSQFVQLRQLARPVIKTLRQSLDALARSDVALALQIVREDASLDSLYAEAMQALIKHMQEAPHSISTIVNELWALKALERIGDHASNVGEQVIYMVKGQDVRHLGAGEIPALS
ncbi:MAG: phosphate signaling complex protein PhoU [Aequoribacter sp.]|uniref:phosphate signaling complex protein PhoU n=1 Tax=Aequoribacter sp. TaxID=2847771 RepID=UPI003C586018